jgi:hypothetical protein
MSFLRRSAVPIGLLAILAFVAGCGGTVIDTSKIEQELEANLSNSLQEKVSSVDCPSGENVEPGSTFTCKVKLPKGKEKTVTLKIRDKDADVSIVKLSGSNE